MSIPQVLCLTYLQNSDNFQSTQGEIKKFLNLNSSTVNGIVSRLEAKSLLARLPKTGDKRVVTIALTEKGNKLLNNIPELLHEQLSKNLEKLDKSQLEQIEESLGMLINILEIKELDASPLITIESNIEETNSLSE